MTIQGPSSLPPLHPPSEAELAAIARTLQDTTPERLISIADNSLMRARSVLRLHGSRADANLVGGNLAWAYVALQKLLFGGPSGLNGTETHAKLDLLQAIRDIARGT